MQSCLSKQAQYGALEAPESGVSYGVGGAPVSLSTSVQPFAIRKGNLHVIEMLGLIQRWVGFDHEWFVLFWTRSNGLYWDMEAVSRSSAPKRGRPWTDGVMPYCFDRSDLACKAIRYHRCSKCCTCVAPQWRCLQHMCTSVLLCADLPCAVF